MMYRNIISGMLVTHGCIHNLEQECDVLNIELGDCELECEGEIVWRCPYFYLNVRQVDNV